MALNIPALRFEAEAFRLGEDKILGRQSAGDAFLRALLALPELGELVGCGPNQATGQAFAQTIAATRKDIKTGWVPLLAHEALRQVGALHFPDPSLHRQALGRMPLGANAYSLSGVTHTIASSGIMHAIARYADAPLMEWDGVICTSDAVKASLLEVLEEQESYLAWRLPGAGKPPRIQLPVIPLGVHCDDFTYGEDQRAEARKILGLGAGDVAFLFVGRLSFHAKANPFPMYAALEDVAKRTGRRIALIQCGWFANEAIEKTFKEGAERLAPSVRHLWLDGRKAPERDRAWAAGDVFVSLSDNIQETFGLTPLEAMAAGMPVLVSDWNGYRQTVQNGVNGVMVPTSAPQPGSGERYATAHAEESINYDHYLAMTARHISVDLGALCDAVEMLVTDAGKRREMGEAGRRIAREQFDWSLIVRRYIAFWDELAAIRKAAAADDPRCMPRMGAERLDPFRVFANYPSRTVGPDTVLRPRPGCGHFATLMADPLFNQLRNTLPAESEFAKLLNALGPDGGSLGMAAGQAGIGALDAVLMATLLLKMGVLETG